MPCWWIDKKDISWFKGVVRKSLEAQSSVSQLWVGSVCLYESPLLLSLHFCHTCHGRGEDVQSMSLTQATLPHTTSLPSLQEPWLFHVPADLCQADSLLRGNNDLRLINQLQLLIPSDFNESTNTGKPYLTNTVWTSRREDTASGH